MSPDEVLAELTALQAGDLPTHGGATMAYVYDSGLSGLEELAAAAQAAFQWTNALDPTAFPSVARLENDLVGAAARLLGGGPGTVGTLTSGGTESCLLAVLSARETWRARGRAGRPRLLLPVTAHAAFRKAAHLFDLDVVDVPVDPTSCRAVPAAVAGALDEQAALVVVSAPSYPHGVLDPVGEIAAMAASAGVPCHVDACIGGWILPFLDDVPEPFDLSVDGVTSLSVDLHKYGYAPKGVSVLLTATPELRHAHWFTTAGWPGYPVVNPTLAGTRPAGPMAAAWAVHRWLGDDGYRELARRTRAATVALTAGASAIEGLRVVGTPVATLVALAQEGPRRGRRAESRRRDDRARLDAAAPAVVRAGRRRPPGHAAPDRDRRDRGASGGVARRPHRGRMRGGGAPPAGRRPGPRRGRRDDRPHHPHRRRGGRAARGGRRRERPAARAHGAGARPGLGSPPTGGRAAAGRRAGPGLPAYPVTPCSRAQAATAAATASATRRSSGLGTM
ncbi:hypothetical protein GCM10010531_32120 [Blastococcus jejuensis]|uniref:Glutamate or tyrosine decarboxylase n=1 Tax=Blastococcus jejuensis TaxID=351224 RepID=A0ABP6PDQ2_9ACTN